MWLCSRGAVPLLLLTPSSSPSVVVPPSPPPPSSDTRGGLAAALPCDGGLQEAPANSPSATAA